MNMKPNKTKLSKEALLSFSTRYLEQYGVALSLEEADRLAWDLLKVMGLTYKPIPKNYGN